MVEGKEVKRHKNIELPDSIKEVELLDFHFNVPADGKITFEIHYASGVLPETFPEPRAKVTRAEKAAAKAQKKAMQEEAAETPAPEETALAIIPEEPPIMQATEPEETMAEPETVEDTTEQAVESPKATAVGDFIGTVPVYQKVPTYAFAIGSYIIDRNGKLSGEKNEELTEALAELYLLADIDFCSCCPPRGVHLPVQYNPPDLKIHYLYGNFRSQHKT